MMINIIYFYTWIILYYEKKINRKINHAYNDIKLNYYSRLMIFSKLYNLYSL